MIQPQDQLDYDESDGNEQVHPELPLRVLVCYSQVGIAQWEQQAIQWLLAGLYKAGIVADVVSSPDHAAMTEGDLHSYQWVIVVQTAAVHSLYMQSMLERAGAQHHLQGIMRVLLATPRGEEQFPRRENVPTIDMSQDYARGMASVLLTLQVSAAQTFGLATGGAPPFVRPHWTSIVRREVERSFTWLLIFTTFLITCLVLTPFVVSLYKTKTVAMTVVPQATIAATKARRVDATRQTVVSTPTPPPGAYSQVVQMKPLIVDPLLAQDANHWQVGTFKGGQETCQFNNGAYTISITQPQGNGLRATCLAGTPMFGNLAFQVDMKLIEGDVGGIVWRANGENDYYWFSLDSGGCYEFFRVLNQNKQPVIVSTCLQNIDMHVTKKLTVIARGSTISLYIDRQLIQQVSDTNLTAGQIGIMGISRNNQNVPHTTEVEFRNAQVWQL